MRKIFIDCGGHKGQSIDRFKKSSLYSPDFIIYSFEPIPWLGDKYKNRKDIIFSNKAIWVEDCEKDFYISKKCQCMGSTLKKEKFSLGINKNRFIKVQCIDFSKWIVDNFTKEDYIILKMDIEGAEYDVLNKMIRDGSINYIKKMFAEFHYHKMKMDKKEHDILMDELKKIKGLELLPEIYYFVNPKRKR